LRELTPGRRPKPLLVGTETRDDAAVWKIDARTGLVATVDFFAPVVDDPRDYGRIAAANSLSDVYAMGGRPLYALNVVGWPRSQPFELLGEILAGGAEVAREADCAIIGGHSVDDLEPKYGLAVTGVVHPKRILSNAKARPGDVLLLGKALEIDSDFAHVQYYFGLIYERQRMYENAVGAFRNALGRGPGRVADRTGCIVFLLWAVTFAMVTPPCVARSRQV